MRVGKSTRSAPRSAHDGAVPGPARVEKRPVRPHGSTHGPRERAARVPETAPVRPPSPMAHGIGPYG